MSTLSLDFGSARIVRTPRRTARAGLIGCGTFGSGILAQAGSVPLLEVPAVADRSLDAARRSLARGGVPEDAILVCDNRGAALAALEAGKRVVVADPLLLMDLPLDVIVEATGQPEAGARHAEAAIRRGKHVAMVNKEADVTVGPILHRLAEEAGVVYTAVDGDQHGLLIGLVAWARRLGLEVLCGGKSRDMEIRTEEAKAFQPLEGPGQLAERHARLGARSRIGNWDLVELVIAANATGLVPDLPSNVHCPAVTISEIPSVLCPTEMGGILRSRGVIDAVTCLRRPHEAGLGGGVFVVVTAANDAARAVLQRGGVCSNGDGTATLITRPYHLLGVEAIHSILAAALLGAGTGGSGPGGRPLGSAAVEYRPRFDVAYRAARDLEAGTLLGDDHSPDLEALIAPAAPLAGDRPLPAHLASGNRLARAVPRGTVITREMVVPPADSALWALRARQDACFFPGPESVNP